ncbi:MAG TPA: autotransporter domain-containing protein [Casimicrobiaceae bacterium]|nr:autotransporter domain-containing protein [Casimicrobiaceae bacterium]
MPKFKRALLAGAVGVALSTSAAAGGFQFSSSYFFGDSLTDSGYYKPVVPPGQGLFTTNPGPVWSTVIANKLGTTANPSNTPNGTNYAQGGAQVATPPGIPPVPPTVSATPIATQVQTFLAKGPLDPRGIYSIQGGADDLFYQLGLLQAGQATSAQVQAALGQSAVTLGTLTATLGVAGAKYILVWNLPDVGKTPFGVGSGAAAQISQLVALYNSTLNATLDASGVQAIRLNTFALFNEALASPAAFGLTNVTTPGCTTQFVYQCTPSTLINATVPQNYLWANDVHPTTVGHQIMADYAYSFIVAPQQIAALGQAPFAVEEANFRALDGRMWSNLNGPRPRGKFEAWAAYDYGNIDMNAGPDNSSGHQNTIVVGGDMKLSDKFLVGVMFGYADQKGEFGGPGGGYKLQQPVGTIYAGYGDGPWYVGATVGGGSLDYSDINRVIPLGALMRTETGQTRGNEFTARLLGGYWFQWQDILHGPWARVAYQKTTVKQYAETGSDSTALIFGQQQPDQLLWSLGWQATGNIGSIRPFARASWEYESLNGDRSVSASSVTLGGWYSIPAAKPDNNYALFNLGASADFGGVTGFVYGSATAGKGDGNYYAITVGVRVPL